MISLIQHFEADFLKKFSLKILNSGVILKTFTYVLIFVVVVTVMNGGGDGGGGGNTCNISISRSSSCRKISVLTYIVFQTQKLYAFGQYGFWRDCAYANARLNLH